MRMTDTILPGHTSQDTIKGSANYARLPFSFPPCWQQGETSRHKEEHFSLYPRTIPTADRWTFHLERAHFNLCSTAPNRRPFTCQLFLPPKPNGPRRICLRTKFLHSHLQLSYDHLRLTAQGKIENHQ